MSPWTCLPGLGVVGVCLDSLCISPMRITVQGHTVAPTAHCPVCGHMSGRVHSHYRRTLADLPSYGIVTELRLTARRFFCDNPHCTRRVFAEPLDGLTAAYARRTDRLLQAQRWIGLALGGQAGARLATRLGMPTSGDSLLRMVHLAPLPPAVTPLILGVDDWALCRGQRYGTILCDLEKHRPVDLLPERSTETLRAWLTGHPGVQVISRDRGGDYARGAAAGAPQATQVADRWHLLHNLHDALVRIADRCHPQIRLAARETAKLSSPTSACVEELSAQAPPPPSPTPIQILSQQRRARRLARYQQVIDLRRQGVSQRTIAKRLGMGREAVRRFVQAGTFPERAKRISRSQADLHMDYLRRRWSEGCRNVRTLTKELAEQGQRVSYYSIRRLIAGWRSLPWQRDLPAGTDAARATAPAPVLNPPSSNRVAWLVQRPEMDLDEQEHALVDRLGQHCPDLRTGADLASEFTSLIHERRVQDLDAWIILAKEPCSVREMAAFAGGLEQDYAAVRAAVVMDWSNGQVEGQVNRLKLVKRQMYGRAGFDLLRRRFLDTG